MFFFSPGFGSGLSQSRHVWPASVFTGLCRPCTDFGRSVWQLMGCVFLVSTWIVTEAVCQLGKCKCGSVLSSCSVYSRAGTELVVRISRRTAFHKNDPLFITVIQIVLLYVHRHHKDCSVTTGSPGWRPHRPSHSSWARMAWHLSKSLSTSVLKFRTFFFFFF